MPRHYDPESEARRASDARALEFEKRWIAQIAKELDNLSKIAYQRIGTVSGLQAALVRLENTQVEATDDDIVSFVKRVRSALKNYEKFDELMSRLAEEAVMLEEQFS